MSEVSCASSVRKKKLSFALSSRPSVRMCVGEQRDMLTMSSPEVSWPVPMRAIGAQNLLTMPGGVSTAGYLHKKGGSQFSLMKWPLRYIIIHKGCVYYFKTSSSPSPQGAFSLNGYNRVMRAAEETTSSNVFPFKIIHFSKKHRTWFLSAASEDERRKWMRYLRREIDYYNDRRDSHIPSDSDSDADSFYGSIERPMDIKHSVDNASDDYVEDEDDDEEDYLKPDTDYSPVTDYSPSSTGKPVAPPPSYHPPPVPSLPFHKLPPPPVPAPNRTPPAAAKKPPPPAFPPPPCLPKGPPPPPPPFQKLGTAPPPPPPPPNGKRRMTSLHEQRGDHRGPPPSAALPLPATLPFCKQVESRLAISTPAHNQGFNVRHGAVGAPGGIKLGPPLPPPPNFVGLSPGFGDPRFGGMEPVPHVSPLPPPPSHRPVTPPSVPHHKPGGPGKRLGPKPPPPTSKPPVPSAKPRFGGTTPGLQRASGDGQSFRTLGDEVKKKPKSKHGGEEDSDDDYENVHLPASVFINTTDTGDVEMLFLKCPNTPRDGLYAIRKGTRTPQVLVVWDESQGKARNYRLFEEEETVFLDSDVRFPSLDVLVEHYYSHPLPNHGSLCLQQPYLPYIQPPR